MWVQLDMVALMRHWVSHASLWIMMLQGSREWRCHTDQLTAVSLVRGRGGGGGGCWEQDFTHLIRTWRLDNTQQNPDEYSVTVTREILSVRCNMRHFSSNMKVKLETKTFPNGILWCSGCCWKVYRAFLRSAHALNCKRTGQSAVCICSNISLLLQMLLLCGILLCKM